MSAESTGERAVAEPPAPERPSMENLVRELRCYLVVQVIVNDQGHRRTHVYRSVAAAQAAIARAQGRGRSAHATLCQLVPVDVPSLATGGLA